MKISKLLAGAFTLPYIVAASDEGTCGFNPKEPGVSFNVGIPEDKLFSIVDPDEPPFKNILSFDGGGIRGLISSQVTDYIEKQLYVEAVRRNTRQGKSFTSKTT